MRKPSERMLRSPNPVNRTSPPVTRSVSRNGGYRHSFVDTSTPLTRRSTLPVTGHETVERVCEAADDTDLDLNSSQFIYPDHLTPREMGMMKKEIWCDWLRYYYRVARRRFVPSLKTFREFFMIVTLAAMFCFYLKDTFSVETQNRDGLIYQDAMLLEKQKFQQSISNLKSSLERVEEKFDGRHQSVQNQIESLQEWKESVMKLLEDIKMAQRDLSHELYDVKNDLETQKNINISQTIITELADRPEPAACPLPPMPAPTPKTRSLPGVNVANRLIGASIDTLASSRTSSPKDGLFYNLMSYVVSFEGGYVLLDRDVLTPGEAWCTHDERPTLTVNLARWVLPSAVSYQHVRWNGIVPDHAPKVYDLVACLSPCCTDWEPLVTDCIYDSTGDALDVQEQFCTIASYDKPVKHVQFRFRENHGHKKMTCAYLVRVYGEPVEAPKEPEPAEDNTTAFVDPVDPELRTASIDQSA